MSFWLSTLVCFLGRLADVQTGLGTGDVEQDQIGHKMVPRSESLPLVGSLSPLHSWSPPIALGLWWHRVQVDGISLLSPAFPFPETGELSPILFAMAWTTRDSRPVAVRSTHTLARGTFTCHAPGDRHHPQTRLPLPGPPGLPCPACTSMLVS